MSGDAKAPRALAVPRSGAFAAAPGAPAQGSVLAEVVADQVAAHPPAAQPEPPQSEPEPVQPADVAEPVPAAPAPAGRARKARRRGGIGDAPLPARLAETDKMQPLQVKVPQQAHWRLKTATTLLASNMTRVVTALLSVYNEDPELGETLIEMAERSGVTLGEMLHDQLLDLAANGVAPRQP